MTECQRYFGAIRIDFSFNAGDRDESPHVHVDRVNCEAKFWLDPVRLQRSHRFSANGINNIEKLVIEQQGYLLERWDEFFNG